MEPRYKIGDKVYYIQGDVKFLYLGIVKEVIETDQGNFYNIFFSNQKKGVVSERSLEPYKLMIRTVGTKVFLMNNNQIIRASIEEIRDTGSFYPEIHYGIRINQELIKFEPEDVYRTEEDILHYLRNTIKTE